MPLFLQKFGIYIGGFAIIGLLAYLLVMSEVQNGKLEVHNATLESNQETQQLLIKDYYKQIDYLSQANIELAKSFSANNNELKEQQKVFNGHNLGDLLEQKPTTIIRLANSKTAEVFDGFSTFTQEFEKNEVTDEAITDEK